MKIGLPFLTQIQGSDQAGTLDTNEQQGDQLGGGGAAPVQRDDKGGWIAQTFRTLVAGLTTAYHTEHHDDDTHSAIHCDSIAERDRLTAMGVWISANIDAASAFSGSGSMTWTVDIGDQFNSYMLVGTTMILNVRIDTSSVGGVVSQFLRMRVPDGFKVARNASAACLIYDATTTTTGVAVLGQMRALTSAPTIIDFIRADAANFAASANATAIVGQLAFEVQ